MSYIYRKSKEKNIKYNVTIIRDRLFYYNSYDIISTLQMIILLHLALIVKITNVSLLSSAYLTPNYIVYIDLIPPSWPSFT